ncbi:hypothetical protein ABPG74_017032 [Tetrahymena malaccensis]
MKPASITKKIEQMLEMNSIQNKEDKQEDEQEKVIEINEKSILKYSQGCKSLSQVVRLKLIGCKISQLEKLELVPQLKFLNISFSNIQKIQGLNKLKELKDAILCNNQIQQIGGLEENKQLTSLDLSYNKISEIENLNHLTKLTVLNLSSNIISLIQCIDNLKNLSQLFLENNKIKKIDFFPLLPNLQEISLKGNHIESINPKLFENLKNLEELNLSNNKIRSLEFLNSLPNLEKFYCSHNLIEKCFMKIQFENLEHLDLSHNQIQETKRFGEYFPNLFTLDISYNNIFIEDELTFVYDMDSLCDIDFSNNLVCTQEFLEQFLRRHPEIDVVNGKVIKQAGYRFEVEMQEVVEEIKEFEKKQKTLNLTQELDNDESFTEEDKEFRRILKQNIQTDLTTVIQEIQKEKEQEKKAQEDFIVYYKHLNEEITLEDLKKEAKKRKDRELFGSDEEDLNDEEQEGGLTLNQNQTDSEDELNEKVNRYNNLQKTVSKNKLQKFDSYVTLNDDKNLNAFVTDLESDLTEIKAKYHAIKGFKHAQKFHHNKSQYLSKSQQNLSLSDLSQYDDNLSASQLSERRDEMNLTSSSFKNYETDNSSDARQALKNIEKNIIIKKKKIPLLSQTSQISNTSKTNISVNSATSTLNNIPINQSKPGLPIPRNPLLQKELKEFKKNMNDPDYLRKLGIGNDNLNLPSDKFVFNATQARAQSQMYNKTAQLNKTSNLSITQRPTRERSSSINKLRNFSATKKDGFNNTSNQNPKVFGQNSIKAKKEKTENLDSSNIEDRSSLSIQSNQQVSPTKTIGIIYSNKNSKTKSKLIDAIANSQK